MPELRAINDSLLNIQTTMLANASALGRIEESIITLKNKAELVDKHERAYNAGKWMSVPFLFVLQMVFKKFLDKIGWY